VNASDEPMTAAPRISVVMPTYNRRARLQRVLESLARQDVDEPFEVVVVSDGSTDGTNEYLAGDGLPLPVVACMQDRVRPVPATPVSNGPVAR
jgi:glycosyltransferase involved in cell wall biosynthesis